VGAVVAVPLAAVLTTVFGYYNRRSDPPEDHDDLPAAERLVG
jgi:hypothetical protein